MNTEIKEKVLIVKSEEFNHFNSSDFDRVIILSETREGKSKDNYKYEYRFLPRYFMRSHSLCREVNKRFLDQVGYSAFSYSLCKIVDKELFEAARLVLIAKEIPSNCAIYIIGFNASLTQYLLNLLGYNSINLNFLSQKIRANSLSKYKELTKKLIWIAKGFVSYYTNKRDVNISRIVVHYNDSNNFTLVQPFMDQNVLSYPILNGEISKNNIKYKCNQGILLKKIIAPGMVNLLFSNYKKYNEIIDRFDLNESIKELFKTKVLDLSYEIATFLSLKKKYKNLNVLIGCVDTVPYIDLLTEEFNKKGVKTACMPHGVNFKYKVHYISAGVNEYYFWSKSHKKTFTENLIDKNPSTIYKITGNSQFVNLRNGTNKRNSETNKRILVIGEYFPNDGYYLSPFNKKDSSRFFNVLKRFKKEYNDVIITVRTRLYDEYFNVAQEVGGDLFKYSSPDKRTIKQEMLDNDIIISVFSNALHESLLLNKLTLQVNLLNIENYRTLAAEGLLFYADTEEQFYKQLKKLHLENGLTLEYKRHDEEYLNDCKFNNPQT